METINCPATKLPCEYFTMQADTARTAAMPSSLVALDAVVALCQSAVKDGQRIDVGCPQGGAQ